MLKLRRVEFFGFNLLFTLSFFACCYIFPIFVYPIAPMYSLFEFGYDPNVISKCTALASVAYSCYVCGLLKNIKGVVKYRAENQNEILQIVDSYVDSKIIYRIALLIFVLFLLSGGYYYLDKQYSEGIMGGGGVVAYLYALVSVIPVMLTYVLNCDFSKKYVLISLFFVFLLLSTGSRTFPLALLLGAFYVYSSKHRVSNILTIILLIVGLLIMSFIGSTRGGQESVGMNTDVGYWNVFLDLIVNNRNLYDAYSLVESKGIVPTVFLGPILAALPMSQSFFVALTGVPEHTMTSASYFTVETFGSNPPFGLGTNIVGDVFLGGGLIAVIILFYLLGYLVTKALYMIHVKKNLTWYIFYLALVTSGIYICRGAFFLVCSAISLVDDYYIHSQTNEYTKNFVFSKNVLNIIDH